jgi:hypothetical protein
MERPARPRPNVASSPELAFPFRVLRLPSGRAFRSRPKPFASHAAPSHEVPPPSAFPRSEQRHTMAALPTPSRPAPPGFLNLMTPLCPPRACRPCFVPDPLLGFTLQSLAPPVQPHAVSGAVALLSFESRFPPPSRDRRQAPLPKQRHSTPAPFQRSSTESVAFRALLHTKVRHFPSTV